MTRPLLTPREREHLAVLRVTAMAAGPGAELVGVRRTDLLAALAAVDRLVEAPTGFGGQARASFIAGTMVILGGACTGHHPAGGAA